MSGKFTEWITNTFKQNPLSLLFFIFGAVLILLGFTTGFDFPVLKQISTTPEYRNISVISGIFFLLAAIPIYYFPPSASKSDKQSETETSLLSRSPEIIKEINDRLDRHYLVDAGYRHHIPDAQTFEYLGELLGFRWEDVKSLRSDEIDKYPIRIPLPSIERHCLKFRSAELTIRLAVWGSKYSMNNVTNKVSKKISAGKLDMEADTATLGDPIPDPKWLMVAYSYGGKVNVKTVNENENLSLP